MGGRWWWTHTHTHQTVECDTLVLPHFVQTSQCHTGHPTTVVMKVLNFLRQPFSSSQTLAWYFKQSQTICCRSAQITTSMSLLCSSRNPYHLGLQLIIIIKIKKRFPNVLLQYPIFRPLIPIYSIYYNARPRKATNSHIQ